MTWLYIIFDHNVLFRCGCGHQRNRRRKKERRVAGNFDHHGGAVCSGTMWGALPNESLLCFARSHWMPPSGGCLHHIAPAAAMGRWFRWKAQNTDKKLLLASLLTVDQSQKSWEFFTPTWTLYSAHWCNKLCLRQEHHDWRKKPHAHSSYQRLSEAKNWKSY